MVCPLFNEWGSADDAADLKGYLFAGTHSARGRLGTIRLATNWLGQPRSCCLGYDGNWPGLAWPQPPGHFVSSLRPRWWVHGSVSPVCGSEQCVGLSYGMLIDGRFMKDPDHGFSISCRFGGHSFHFLFRNPVCTRSGKHSGTETTPGRDIGHQLGTQG